MKKVIKKGLSCLIAGLMAFSGISGALAANEGGASDAGNENVIDLSHDSPAGSGATFGVEVDALWRWQTFEATKDGVIDNVEVYVVKRSPTSGDAKPGNLVAAIYPITDGVAGEALQTVTVPEAQVNDKAPTSIDFNVQVEAGKRYALALTTDPLGQQDAPVTQPTYDWVNKDIGLNDTLPSGKINPSGAWVDETKYINTLWCKIHYASESENVPPVDFTFDTSDTTWGYGVGAGEGEAARYQTFTAPASAKMTSAEVFLLPKGRAAPPFANLIAKLYDTNEDGTPKTELASVTKPYTEIPGNGVYKLDLAYQLEAGKRYAVVLTTDKLAADNSGNNGDHYNWPTSNPAQPGEFFGAITPAGVASDQTNLGTAYLKVNFNEKVILRNPSPQK